MPNWTGNYLLIEGEESDVAKLKAQVSAPFTQLEIDTDSDKEIEISYSNPVFAFWNICKPTDMHAYLYSKSTGVPKKGGNWFQSDNWYDWNIRNWGTKWDIAKRDGEDYHETTLETDEPKKLDYRFSTAWSPPIEAITKLSEQHPKLEITLEYLGDGDSGGEIKLSGGKVIEESHYEFKCPDCDFESDEEPYCEDCESNVCPKCKYTWDLENRCKKHEE